MDTKNTDETIQEPTGETSSFPHSSEGQEPIQMPFQLPGVSEILRKAVVAGLGAAVIGEKSVRYALRELKPGAKEAIDSALSQAERGKEEIRRLVNEELKRLGDSPALKREIAKSLSAVAIEMTVKIRLNPDGSGPDITFSQPRLCWVKDKGQNSDSGPASTSKTPEPHPFEASDLPSDAPNKETV